MRDRFLGLHLEDALSPAMSKVHYAFCTLRDCSSCISYENGENDLRRGQLTSDAIRLSGTSDRSSRAYKSARRRLERYRTTAGEQRDESVHGKPGPKPLHSVAQSVIMSQTE
jgi:hypothetical protein